MESTGTREATLYCEISEIREIREIRDSMKDEEGIHNRREHNDIVMQQWSWMLEEQDLKAAFLVAGGKHDKGMQILVMSDGQITETDIQHILNALVMSPHKN